MDFIGEHHIPRDLTQGIGSTDVGNVTQALPAAQFYIGVGEGLGTHTAAFADAAGGEAGRRALTAAVKVLAMTGLDIRPIIKITKHEGGCSCDRDEDERNLRKRKNRQK